jgi:hypothetical protein
VRSTWLVLIKARSGLHDKFNKDENLREKHIHFPEGTFVQPLPVNDFTDWLNKWPNGIA